MRLELSMLLHLAGLARRQPYDAQMELRRVRRYEQERIDQENLANSRSTITYSRAASILIGAGIKPSPPIWRPPATNDPRFESWSRYIDGLIEAFKAAQSLATTAAVLACDATVLDRSGDVRGLTDRLLKTAASVPDDWPERAAFARTLRLDAIEFLERGGRLAAVAERYATAREWFAEVERLCMAQGLDQRASRNRLAQVDVGIHEGMKTQALLNLLGEASPWFSLLPHVSTLLETGYYDFTSALHDRQVGVLPLLPIVPFAVHNRYGPANTLDGAYSRLLHAILLDDSGRTVEAHTRLEEARSFVEPQPGRIVAPTREQLLELMSETATRQQAGRAYGETLDQLNELLRHRMVAMIYCEVAKRLNAGNPVALHFYESAATRLDLLIENNNPS
jgi:hypothetical protein